MAMRKSIIYLIVCQLYLWASELPIPFSYKENGADSRAGTSLFLFETKETSHYLNHFFHLLEHVVGLWSFYGNEHFQDVHLIVLAVDKDPSLPLVWEGPNAINRHLLQALFPQAKVKTWKEFYQDRQSFAKSITSDRARSFLSPECLQLNKMLGTARHFLSKEALQHMADRVHSYAGTKFQKKTSLRITYLKRPLPRALNPVLESDLLSAIQMLENVSLRVEDFAVLSFQEQVGIIGNTDVLIGVHGNGLSHLLFLPPHARVIEIFPPKAHALDYRLFADARGLNYTGVIEGREILSQKEAYRLGPFGEMNEAIHELNIPLILAEIVR